MRDVFDDREQSEEAKFKLQKELQFKIDARCGKLLGLWAAARMGISGDEAAAYAMEVVVLGLKAPGSRDVAEKISNDMTARGGGGANGDEIRQAIKRFQMEAYEQVAAEYPKALAPDHLGTAG